MAAAEGTIVLTRSAAVTRVLARVLAANLAVAIAKLVFGYGTATVSIISDGFHSLTDAAANVVALVGLRASGKPPDVDHPYGHRKFETLTAAAIVALLVLVIAEVVRTSLQHLGGASAPRVSAASFAVMLATLAVNLVVVGYERRAATRLTSELLLADAMHTRSDVLTSLGVLASLVGVWLGFPILDPLSGLVVAMVIGHTGFQIGRQATHILADRIVIPEEDLRDGRHGRTRRARLPPHPHARHRRSCVPGPSRVDASGHASGRSPPVVARRQGRADAALSADRGRDHPHRTAAGQRQNRRIQNSEESRAAMASATRPSAFWILDSGF